MYHFVFTSTAGTLQLCYLPRSFFVDQYGHTLHLGTVAVLLEH